MIFPLSAGYRIVAGIILNVCVAFLYQCLKFRHDPYLDQTPSLSHLVVRTVCIFSIVMNPAINGNGVCLNLRDALIIIKLINYIQFGRHGR
jgi:hypothetical protein